MSTKKVAEKKVTRKVTKPLACHLTEPEVLAYGKDLARAHADSDRIQTEFDSIKQDYKGKLEEQGAIISKLAGRVHSGLETRDVECVEEKNWTKLTVTVTRNDTGETIEARPMREDEKQAELSYENADPGEPSPGAND